MRFHAMLWNNGQTSTSGLVERKSKVYLHISAIYAPSVTCERMYSTAGKIVSEKRSYLLNNCQQACMSF